MLKKVNKIKMVGANDDRINVSRQGKGEINFLPFLDILFSTMGIFLIVIFLHERLSNLQEVYTTTKIDTLVVCFADGHYEWFGSTSDTPLSLEDDEAIQEKIIALVKDLKANPRILAAFTADAIATQHTLKNTFDKLSRSEKIAIQPIWWPLNESDNSYATLVEKWVSGKSIEVNN